MTTVRCQNGRDKVVLSNSVFSSAIVSGTDMALELELISPFDVAKDAVKAIQDYSILAAQSLTNFFRRPLYWGDILQQADLIGVGSLPIVVLSGLSIGALLALNSASM